MKEENKNKAIERDSKSFSPYKTFNIKQGWIYLEITNINRDQYPSLKRNAFPLRPAQSGLMKEIVIKTKTVAERLNEKDENRLMRAVRE